MPGIHDLANGLFCPPPMYYHKVALELSRQVILREWTDQLIMNKELSIQSLGETHQRVSLVGQ